MTVRDFRTNFGVAFTRAGNDSAGYDAMESLARSFDNKVMDFEGSIYWERPYAVKPEAKGKLPIDLKFGDLAFDSANFAFYLDEMDLKFRSETTPVIEPDLSAFGLENSVRDVYPLGLPMEYLIVNGRDSVLFQRVLVRGRVSVDWSRGLRTKHEPMKSISLEDCEIVEVLPSTP
jgi:hypothetical protein